MIIETIDEQAQMKQVIIAVVEDDLTLAELLLYNLQSAGYSSVHFKSGDEFLAHFATLSPSPQLVIMDVMMPGSDGFATCASLRRLEAGKNIPVLMLTALGSERDKIAGLDSGADDYLTKPFGMAELAARLRALLRRSQLSPQATNSVLIETNSHHEKSKSATAVMQHRNLMLDDEKHRVFSHGQEVVLTKREYDLLRFFLMNRGVSFTRDELLNLVWGYDYAGATRTVDVHVRQLRRKLAKSLDEPELIETVRGSGYRFSEA